MEKKITWRKDRPRTSSAKDVSVLRNLRPQHLYSFVQGNQSPIRNRARKHGPRGLFAEKMFTNEATDAIGSNHRISVGRGTVFETNGNGRTFLIT